jgi:hypothetical protein
VRGELRAPPSTTNALVAAASANRRLQRPHACRRPQIDPSDTLAPRLLRNSDGFRFEVPRYLLQTISAPRASPLKPNLKWGLVCSATENGPVYWRRYRIVNPDWLSWLCPAGPIRQPTGHVEPTTGDIRDDEPTEVADPKTDPKTCSVAARHKVTDQNACEQTDEDDGQPPPPANHGRTGQQAAGRPSLVVGICRCHWTNQLSGRHLSLSRLRRIQLEIARFDPRLQQDVSRTEEHDRRRLHIDDLKLVLKRRATGPQQPHRGAWRFRREAAAGRVLYPAQTEHQSSSALENCRR